MGTAHFALDPPRLIDYVPVRIVPVKKENSIMSKPETTSKARSTQDLLISSTFKFMTSRPIDAKNRVSLGQPLLALLKQIGSIDSFNVYIDQEGYVLLVPMHTIPAAEMWTWTNKKVRESFDRATEDARRGRVTEVDDLDQFIESL